MGVVRRGQIEGRFAELDLQGVDEAQEDSRSASTSSVEWAAISCT